MQGGYSWIGIEFGNRFCIQSLKVGEYIGSADVRQNKFVGILRISVALQEWPRYVQMRGSDQIRYCGAILELIRVDVPGNGYQPGAPDCRPLIFLDCEIGRWHTMTWA